MKKTSRIASLLSIAVLAATLPVAALAQTIGVNANVGVQTPVTSTVVGATTGVSVTNAPVTTTTGTHTSARFTTAQTAADAAISARISSLNSASTRLGGVKNLSASEVTSLQGILSAQITEMNTLEAQINSDTTGATLRADAATITKNYRIYLLVLPQVRIAATSDRIDTIVGLMQGLAPKLETRITAAGNPSAAVSAYTDMNAKISDANTQAAAALSETVGLQPDQGNTTIEASNSATIKDAKSKIQTATNDLKAARADIATIYVAVKGSSNTSTTAPTNP